MKINIIGLRFSDLVVLEQLPSKNKQSIYLCQCDCGNTTYSSASRLFRGIKKSCGCKVYRAKKTKDPLNILLKRMQKSSRKRKETMDITLDFLWEQYILQGGKCYYTGLPLDLNVKTKDGKSNPYSISVDRIDSTLGYVETNIVLTCLNINLFKNQMNLNEFVEMVENLKKIDNSEIPFYKTKML